MPTMDPATLASMGLLPGAMGVGMSAAGQQAFMSQPVQQTSFVSAGQFSAVSPLVPPAFLSAGPGMPQAMTGGLPTLAGIPPGLGVGMPVEMFGADMFGGAATLGQAGMGLGVGVGVGAPFGGAPPMEQLGGPMSFAQLAPPPPLMQQQHLLEPHFNPRPRGHGRNQKR